MNKMLSSVFFAAAVTVFATGAFADDTADPALFQSGTNCNVPPPGTYWCASDNITTADPNTGLTTLEFVIQTTDGVAPTARGMTAWTTFGLVAATSGVGGTGTVQDLLDFEKLGGQDVVFLYCGDGHCTSGDSGLPTATEIAAAGGIKNSYQDGTQYVPTSGQVGQALAYDPLNSPPVKGAAVGYQIVDPVSTPEPSAVVLFGSMMIGLAAFARKKFAARA
jgi:hypothetical protein